jgi:CSLREA domain-containing protein
MRVINNTAFKACTIISFTALAVLFSAWETLPTKNAGSQNVLPLGFSQKIWFKCIAAQKMFLSKVLVVPPSEGFLADNFIPCSSDAYLDVYTDGLRLDIPKTMSFPTASNIDSVRAEIVYSGTFTPPNPITILGSNGVTYTAWKQAIVGDDDAWVYNFHIPVGVSSLTYENEDEEYKAQSLTAFVYRSGVANPQSITEIHVQEKFHHTTKVFNVTIPTAATARDVNVKVPLTELSYDGRTLTVQATVNGSTQTITKTYGPGEDDFPAGCCSDILAFNFNNVPGAVDEVVVTCISPTNNGQSILIAGVISVGVECPTGPEICYDGVDNDGDGLVDWNDSECVQLNGIVFEDQNYGGGAGRTLTAAGDIRVPNARVELYSAAGNFLASTLTDNTGTFRFGVNPSLTYFVRAVNSTVKSQRSAGAAATNTIPVMTFRVNASSGTATNVTNYVGGENPAVADAPANTTSLSLNTTTLQINGQQAQSVTRVLSPASGTFSGLRFGFNFNTVVNTNASGQGSLAAVVTNMEVLGGESTMAQAGFRMNNGVSEALPSGYESTIFMIGNGTVRPGLRAGLANQLTSGIAVIGNGTTTISHILNLANASRSILDGTTQTYNIGDTNTGTFGTGGIVGVDNLALCTVQRPEVELNKNIVGFDNVRDCGFRGFAIFGKGTLEFSHENTRNITLEQNVLGSKASSIADFGGYTDYIIGSFDADSCSVRNNIVAYGTWKGIHLDEDSDGWEITCNEFVGNGSTNFGAGAVHLETNTVNTLVQGNLFYNNGTGISLQQDGSVTTTGHRIINNTIRNNNYEGIRTYVGGSSNNNIVISKNRIHNNRQGILLNKADNVTMTQNLIHSHTMLGIDLDAPVDGASEGIVTVNDANDADVGNSFNGAVNDILNFPVIGAASILTSTIQVTYSLDVPTPNPSGVTGYRIEFFANNVADPSGHGEGEIYIGSVTTTNDASNVTISLSLPTGVSLGQFISATTTELDGSTDGFGSTSEFSGTITITGCVVANPVVAGVITVNSAGDTNDTTPGDGYCFDQNCECTLRAAIQEANAYAGTNTVAFNIPLADPRYFNPDGTANNGDEYFNIQLLLGHLPTITEAVTIDGLTQPNAACVPNVFTALHSSIGGNKPKSLLILVNANQVPSLTTYWRSTVTNVVLRGLAMLNYTLTLPGGTYSIEPQNANSSLLLECTIMCTDN